MQTIARQILWPTLAATMLFSAQIANAQAKCVINGEEVPCEQLGEGMKQLLGAGIGLTLLFAAISIAALVFWIMMIVHAASHNINNKAIWIILMVLTGIIGALIYYFAIKRPMNEMDRTATTPASKKPTTPKA